MGLLDSLLRRVQRGPKDTQEEQLAARAEEQSETHAETAQGLEETPLERRDAEAGRHSGI